MTKYHLAGIIAGYSQGNFLMSEDDDDLQWYSSSEHALIPLDNRFRYPTSLRRVINQNRFSVRINGDFRAVVAGCADRYSTWISAELQEIYWELRLAVPLLGNRCFLISPKAPRWQWFNSSIIYASKTSLYSMLR